MAQAEITIENNTHFERLLTTDKTMQRQLNKIVRKAVRAAKKDTTVAAKSALGHDPRAAYKAVKAIVYKKIFGGYVSILSKRHASSMRVSVTNSQRKGNIGGNRCKRSEDTDRMNSYYGDDRGFILRFLESGAKKDGGNRTTRYGNRGSIRARNWFGQSSYAAMQKAVASVEKEIDNIITNTKV